MEIFLSGMKSGYELEHLTRLFFHERKLPSPLASTARERKPLRKRYR